MTVDRRPPRDVLPPLVGELGDYVDPRARILAAFGVVRRRGRHLQRPLGQAPHVLVVELVDGPGAPLEVPTRPRWSRAEARRCRTPCPPCPSPRRGRCTAETSARTPAGRSARQSSTPSASTGSRHWRTNSKSDGSCNGSRRRASAIAASTTAASAGSAPFRADIGAVDRKARDDLDERATERGEGEVAERDGRARPAGSARRRACSARWRAPSASSAPWRRGPCPAPLG